MAIPRYDAILFDVDGTLIDSAPGIIHTLQETFAQLQVDVNGVELKKYVGPPLRQTFGEYFSDEKLIERAINIYRSSYRVKGSRECVLYPGVAEMLHSLKQSGIALYTATSKPIQVVRPILEQLGIATYFTYIGGATMDKSRDTKTAVMLDVLRRPELYGKRVLMVGDRQDDLQGAQDCGIPAAVVLYGYGNTAEYERYCPVFAAGDCTALINYILENGEANEQK